MSIPGATQHDFVAHPMHAAHPRDLKSADFAVISEVTRRQKHFREQQWWVNVAMVQAEAVLPLGTDLHDTSEVMAAVALSCSGQWVCSFQTIPKNAEDPESQDQQGTRPT